MAPTIQIFGIKKCNDTNKAIRFFKERGVKTQFIDLNEKAMSKGELDSVARNFSLEELIDRNGKQYKKRNLDHMVFDLEGELLADPLLLKTPITRFGRESAIGINTEAWLKWIAASK